MANTKLLKVMDYLINEQEDKARELLHQIFIEKARAIHEEMSARDADMEEDMLRGNMGEKLADQIDADMHEIKSEQQYAIEDEDMEVDDAVEDLGDELDMDDEDVDDVDVEDEVEVDMSDEEDEEDMDMDMGADEEEGEHDEHEEIHDLEQAIAELKAEFEALKQEVEGGEHSDEMADADEEEVDEAWETEDEMDEDFDSLDENVDLETVTAAKGGEVGSGRFAPADTNKHSPVPSTQTDTMGAKPVVTGKGPKVSGYDRQAAPSAGHVGPASNRRRKAEDGMSHVSKEGSAKAVLNKDRSDGFGAPGTKSPIQGR